MGLKADDAVILLSTDTIDGKLSADLVKWFLYTRNLCNEGLIRIEKIDGLQATDGARFGDVNFLVETIVAPMPWCYAATGI